jgi:hypothetical protein
VNGDEVYKRLRDLDGASGESYGLGRLLGEGASGWLFEGMRVVRIDAPALVGPPPKRVVRVHRADVTDALAQRFSAAGAAVREISGGRADLVRLLDYGVGRLDGSGPRLVFSVWEQVGAGWLRDHLASGPVPPARALGLVEQVVRAVLALHECNVVHGALRAGSVWIAESGVPGGFARLGDVALHRHGEITPRDDARGLARLLHEVLTGELGLPARVALEGRGLTADDADARAAQREIESALAGRVDDVRDWWDATSHLLRGVPRVSIASLPPDEPVPSPAPPPDPDVAPPSGPRSRPRPPVAAAEQPLPRSLKSERGYRYYPYHHVADLDIGRMYTASRIRSLKECMALKDAFALVLHTPVALDGEGLRAFDRAARVLERISTAPTSTVTALYDHGIVRYARADVSELFSVWDGFSPVRKLWLERGDTQEIVQLGEMVAAAVDRLHAHGVIHGRLGTESIHWSVDRGQAVLGPVDLPRQIDLSPRDDVRGFAAWLRALVASRGVRSRDAGGMTESVARALDALLRSGAEKAEGVADLWGEVVALVEVDKRAPLSARKQSPSARRIKAATTIDERRAVAGWTWRMATPPQRHLALRRAVFVKAGHACLAVGATGIAEWQSDVWHEIFDEGLAQRTLRSICNGPGDEALVLGDGGLVVRATARGTFEAGVLLDPEVALFGASAAGPSDVVVVGERLVYPSEPGHLLVVREGVMASASASRGWSPVAVPSPTPPLRAVAAFHDGRRVAVGERGAILAIAEGRARQVPPVDATDLADVVVLPDGDAIVVGDRGMVLHLGPHLTATQEDVPTARALRRVVVANDFTVWAGGEQGRVLRRSADGWERVSPALDTRASVCALWSDGWLARVALDDGTVLEGRRG